MKKANFRNVLYEKQFRVRRRNLTLKCCRIIEFIKEKRICLCSGIYAFLIKYNSAGNHLLEASLLLLGDYNMSKTVEPA